MSQIKEEVKQEGTFKVKKPKQLSKEDEPIKIDLSKPKTEPDAVQERKAETIPDDKSSGDIPKVEVKGGEPEQKPDEITPIQEIIEEVTEEKVAEEIVESHLDSEEINFLIEDNFSWDEELDEERVIRKTKLAYKEEVAKAKNHLEDLKSKYYDEIKLRPGVTQDQQKAMDFFNRYNEEQNVAVKQHEAFKSNTNEYFSKEFKGFDFNIGEKKFRYGVKSPSEVADKQSNISNIIKKFLNDKGDVTDVKGYHKAMYAAEHADNIAQHFYEQGKSDATKDLVAKSKNIQTEPRQNPPSDVFVNGLKVRAISGMDSSKLKIKTRKFN